MSKTMHSKTKQTRKKVIIIRPINIMALAIIVVFVATLITKIKADKSKIDPNFVVTPEILRSREYDVVNTGEEATNSEYVKFDAFFLKDLNGDGKADSIRGTCNEVGKEDTLYMDLKVINDGYLKDGVIKINSDNFYLNTTIVRDSIVAQNYISNDTKEIKLKNMKNGMQKLFTGIVRSGDYSNQINKTNAIGNDTTKYNKVNSITFTGTHVADNGKETEINKTINFNVDWYGTATSGIAITNVTNSVNSMDELIDGENVNLEFDIEVAEKDYDLILKANYLEGTIPELNGYKPSVVEIKGKNVSYTYDENTNKFTAKREAVVNENGIVTEISNTSQSWDYTWNTYARYNKYKFNLVYPKEAYDSINNTSIILLIPIRTWYEGYNNTNSQFENPYISNISETTISARWAKHEGYKYRFDITVGKSSNIPYYRYVVSKEKPIRIYNNISTEEKEDYYTVRWSLSTGTEGEADTVVMKETETGATQVQDKFIKTDTSQVSMEDVTTNAGIYFSGQQGILGEDGWIKVINDETGDIIETFTKDNWDKYNQSNPYKYETPIKHIRIETSKVAKNSYLSVCNIKELDDTYITTNYTRENFDKLQYIKSTLTGYFDEEKSIETHIAHYEAPLSVAKISINQNQISTQETAQNQIINIKTECSDFNLQKWKNGTYLLKFPSEIINMEINGVTIDNENVKILGYDLYEENENYFLKILTENEEQESYNITIDCNITPDPRTETVNRNIELYAKNEDACDYAENYNSTDTYDIDDDLNTSEIINKDITGISLISPNALLTHQIASNYDLEKNITIAPKVAKTDKEQRTADINISVSNNYSQDVTDVVIQGVIPFEGNKYIMGDGDLGSSYSTWMSNTGITVPSALNNKVKVYYSTEEKPSNNINDTNNKWTLAENVTDWTKIKTYIIDFGEYVMHHGENFDFKYQINIPEGIEYNEVTYSEHGIYFAIMTDQGKYNTFTAANKLGFMIAKQYDLEITKYQEDTEKLLQGINFLITEEGEADGRIKVTNNEGKVKIPGLYAERTYIIKEIKTTDDYALNTEEIKFYTYTDEQDKLHVVYKNDDETYSDLAEKYSWIKSAELVKEENKDYKLNIELENEVKPRLKIIKVDNQTNEKIEEVAFNIQGKGINQSKKTNRNGELEISGLYLNEEYEIKETRKKGYYELEPIKFKIINNNGVYEAQIIQGSIKTQNVETIDSIPQIELTLENEKIPTYNLEIIKIEEKHEEKKLSDTEFLLKGEDDNSQKMFETNEDGLANIENLYQHIEGKAITGKYTIKEIKAPNGYASNQEEVSFVVSKNGDNLEINVENEENLTSFKSAEVDGNTVKLVLQDKPLFKLTKTDKETGEPLANVKFIIYELEEDGTEIDFAKDVNGNYVGELNNKNQYIVTTDEEGMITIPLRNGTYKATEIEAPEGYEKEKAEQYFKISGTEEDEEIGTPDEFNNTLEINYIEDLLDFAQNVNNGNTYSGTKVILKRTLDFNDLNSYRDAEDTTTYGDYNLNGTISNIKTELTTGIGFRGIAIYNYQEEKARPFSGIFDGGGHEINGIHIDYTQEAPANTGDNKITLENPALFRYVKDGKIKRLGTGGKIVAKNEAYASGLISIAKNIEMYSCYNNCNMKNTGGYSGGLIGQIYNNLTMENCSNNADLEFDSNYSGGIIGEALGDIQNIYIKNCSNNGNLIFNQHSCAGLFSYITCSNLTIENCYNYGNLQCDSSGGCHAGIIRYAQGSESCTIKGCINYGKIMFKNGDNGGIACDVGTNTLIYNCINYGDILQSGSNNPFYIGGILSSNRYNSNKIKNCFNFGNLINSNGSYVGGIIGSASDISSIEECGNFGIIKGRYRVGGILGYLNKGNICNVFNSGNIYASTGYIAGIVGDSNESNEKIIKNTYNMRKNI